jgi:hypothetical protein
MSPNQLLRFALVLMVLLVGCRGKPACAPETLHDLVRKDDLRGIEAALTSTHGTDLAIRPCMSAPASGTSMRLHFLLPKALTSMRKTAKERRRFTWQCGGRMTRWSGFSSRTVPT